MKLNIARTAIETVAKASEKTMARCPIFIENVALNN